MLDKYISIFIHDRMLQTKIVLIPPRLTLQSCVVWSSEVISNEMAERIQDIPPFDVKQQTPGRVSHR